MTPVALTWNSSSTRKLVALALTSVLSGCGTADTPPAPVQPPSCAPEPDSDFHEMRLAFVIYQMISAHREVYAEHVVDRLQNEEKVFRASMDWKAEKALPLPSQMLRMSGEVIKQKEIGFDYSLLSLHPVNPAKGSPRTPIERKGLDAVTNQKQNGFYEREGNYVVAVFPDKAVSDACIRCHNNHQTTHTEDYQLGDVMGGIVIRVKKERRAKVR